MIQLSGIFSESLGGTCTIRGYAKYNEIVELSYPHPGYQRPAEDEHVAEISSFITSGSNSFSPEVVLAYTAKYNYYAQGASSEVDALADIRSGKGFTSNVDGIAFKKEKAAGNGFLYTLSIPDKKYDRIEDMYEKELQRILNASQNNALTFFVGAGVSALSGAPTWKALIHAISDKLGRTRKDEYSSDENLQIPQMFYYSEAFDFYCEYAKFDFSRFDVSWLLNLYPHTLEQIAKNAKVKERVRVAIATTLDGEAIAPSDSQRLQSILVKHFC